MAGGVLILLGLNLGEGEHHKARFIGTGMHGGVIYLRGSVEDYQLGKEVGVAELEEGDYSILHKYVDQFSAYFGYESTAIMKHKFTKLFPRWLRPYGRLYAY
jgi:glutamate synthase domain-containing protein 3